MFTLSPTAGQFLKKYSTWAWAIVALGAILPAYLPLFQVIAPKVYGWGMVFVALCGVLATQLKQAGISPPVYEAAGVSIDSGAHWSTVEVKTPLPEGTTLYTKETK